MLVEDTINFFESGNVALVKKFVPYYCASIGCHLANLENKEREFLIEQGTVADLRMHIFMCAPPGFCAVPETEVLLEDGSTKPLSEIEVGDKLASTEDGENVVTEKWNSYKQVYRLEANGFEFKGSKDHLIKTSDGYKPVGDIEVGFDVVQVKDFKDGERYELVDVVEKTEQYRDLIDIETSKEHFIANGIVVHNSKSLLLKKFLMGKYSALSQTEVETAYESFLCVPAGEVISMADGSYKPIERITVGEKVISFNDEKWQKGVGTVSATHKMKGNVLKIRLRSGKVIRVTTNHPLWSVDGWKKAENFEKGEYIGSFQKLDYHEQFSHFNSVFWDRIESIEYLGNMDVYNLTIEPYNTFCVDDIITHNTEAGFVGTIRYDKGEKVVKKGAAYEHKNAIVGIDEFSVLADLMKTDYGKTLDAQLLTALDSGMVIKRLANGKLRYQTNLTLWSGSQPERFDLRSGLGRRLFFIYFIPTESEEGLITESRRQKSMLPNPKYLRDIRKDIEVMKGNVAMLDDITYDRSIYDVLDKFDVLHYEEIPYERLALGYTIATEKHLDTDLHVKMTPELKELFEKEYYWRQAVKRGPEVSQVVQLLKDRGPMLISKLKDKLTDFGMSYKQATETIRELHRAGIVDIVTDKTKKRGRKGRIVRIA